MSTLIRPGGNTPFVDTGPPNIAGCPSHRARAPGLTVAYAQLLSVM